MKVCLEQAGAVEGEGKTVCRLFPDVPGKFQYLSNGLKIFMPAKTGSAGVRFEWSAAMEVIIRGAEGNEEIELAKDLDYFSCGYSCRCFQTADWDNYWRSRNFLFREIHHLTKEGLLVGSDLP